MSEEFNPDLVSVIDENGVEHVFEELDRIETDDGKRYIAMIPTFSEDMLDESGELIILRVSEENGETILEPIEDEEEFNEIGEIFEERLADLFDFEE